MIEGPAQAPCFPVRVDVGVDGLKVRIEASVPDRPVRLDELLPALSSMDDRLIDAAVARLEATGKRISCARGCSACCRVQPVPITPPEASALARLVEALPEQRRGVVRSAFAAAVERLRAAGLYDVYMHRDPDLTHAAAVAVARRYMTLSFTCPFLADDACSIYADRPFVCRQYLVTSPPDLCAAPLDNPVQPVRTPAAFATAMLQAGEALSGRAQYTVPLVLALEYEQANRAELERTYDARAAIEQVAHAFARPASSGP